MDDGSPKVVPAPLVYVVDDDADLRDGAQWLLRAHGCRARTFDDGHALLDALAAANDDARPDCLLIDLNMPRMNGVEIQQQLRARQLGLPVIVMTGAPDSELARCARAFGSAGFLEKPFDDEAFGHALRMALHAAPAR